MAEDSSRQETSQENQEDAGPDIRVEHHGSIILLKPQHDQAESWLRENTDDEAIWMAGKLVVEPRFAEGLINAAAEAGFEVS